MTEKQMPFGDALDLALSLHNTRQYDKAWSLYQQLYQANPDSFDVLNLMGALCLQQGHLGHALKLLRRAVALHDDKATGWNNLASAWLELGTISQAKDAYKKALDLEPDSAEAISNYLYCLNFDASLTPAESFQEHKKYAFRASGTTRPEHKPHRRPRIGYVSGDFRRHSVSYFFLPVLEHHDHNSYDIYCYSNLNNPDSVTAKIKSQCKYFREVYELDDAALLSLIRQDEIDILVDLSGYTRGNRLPVFAQQAAPVQLTWLGYPNTTGMPAMQYRISDVKADPAGSEHFYSEKLLCIPDSFLAYQPGTEQRIDPVPACQRNGYFTFASFNSWRKVTPQVLASWTYILQKTGNSRLLLKSSVFQDQSIKADMLKYFHKRGIDQDRILLQAWLPENEHMALYNQVDLALDTFPYNGTTTTCEALVMAVPVLTLSGNCHASRVGHSLLETTGMPQLITRSIQEYRDKAIALATEQSELAAIRQTIRQAFLDSPLCDGAALARKLEDCYQDMPGISWPADPA